MAAAAAVAAPSAAAAQQKGKLPVVALVLFTAPARDMAGPDPVFPVARAFVHGMRDLGWIDGRNVVIERRSMEGRPEHAPGIIADLAARGVDVLVMSGAVWLLQAAQRVTRTIPIVTLFAEDPVAAGLIASLARPGGNLTGVTAEAGPELIGKRVQLLRELLPRVSRIAFLGTTESWATYRADSGEAKASLIFARVDRPDDYPEAFAAVARERVDALVVLRGPVAFANAPRIVAFAAENRLPAIYPFREAVEGGGLMSYGASVPDMFGQTAGYADRILKGARPAEMPIEQPRRFELAINLKTARALGLTVPPALLGVADVVIE